MTEERQPVRTQALMFTVWGGYIYTRDIKDPVWIGTLIELFGEMGYSEQAVRLAVSRMCRHGWLKTEKVETRSYYSMTKKGLEFLKQGAKRLFPQVTPNGTWDGLWRMFIYSIPEKHSKLRSIIRKELMWLGYGSLAYGVWISPNPTDNDIEALVQEYKLTNYTEFFTANGRDLAYDRKMVEKCWTLDTVNQLYIEFIDNYQAKLQELGDDAPDNLCFRNRIQLNYDFRKLIFQDPDLPKELQPDNWKGGEAAKLFETCFKKWEKGAVAYFDSILVTKPVGLKKKNRKID